MIYNQVLDIANSLNIDSLSKNRILLLDSLSGYIQNKKELNESINLNFICTHNSRRSHLAQIWAQTMAAYFNIYHVNCFSGGTEATYIYETTKKTLEEQGFIFKIKKKESNPTYQIFFSNTENPINGFSKVYNDQVNPKNNFAVIMTCSHADENCPLIPGAEKKISLMYEDPKLFDRTILEKEKYRERSLQIATEMKYVFSKIKLNE